MQIVVMIVGLESLSENKVLLVIVDKSSKYSFAYLLPSKQAKGVPRLVQNCAQPWEFESWSGATVEMNSKPILFSGISMCG